MLMEDGKPEVNSCGGIIGISILINVEGLSNLKVGVWRSLLISQPCVCIYSVPELNHDGHTYQSVYLEGRVQEGDTK
jgi:hypothetical protein